MQFKEVYNEVARLALSKVMTSIGEGTKIIKVIIYVRNHLTTETDKERHLIGQV